MKFLRLLNGETTYKNFEFLLNEQPDIKKKLLGPDLKPQGGRPILIVLTERDGKKYLLVNLHAPNRQPGNVELQMELTHFCINKHIEQALKKFRIEGDKEKEAIVKRMFIMGDFNGVFEA